MYKQVASQIRDIASRIGPARSNEEIRAELEALANQYEFWSVKEEPRKRGIPDGAIRQKMKEMEEAD